jgi:hypothetical protein
MITHNGDNYTNKFYNMIYLDDNNKVSIKKNKVKLYVQYSGHEFFQFLLDQWLNFHIFNHDGGYFYMIIPANLFTKVNDLKIGHNRNRLSCYQQITIFLHSR